VFKKTVSEVFAVCYYANRRKKAQGCSKLRVLECQFKFLTNFKLDLMIAPKNIAYLMCARYYFEGNGLYLQQICASGQHTNFKTSFSTKHYHCVSNSAVQRTK
jgi:hypothetical protein